MLVEDYEIGGVSLWELGQVWPGYGHADVGIGLFL
jgi:hypothetical protein